MNSTSLSFIHNPKNFYKSPIIENTYCFMHKSLNSRNSLSMLIKFDWKTICWALISNADNIELIKSIDLM